MPGMGLTSIGLAGVTISYAGLAHTFIDGMHALTGLTMFIGLIILATGILDGGVSTSNRAKATALVVVSISLGFGMAGFLFNTVSTTGIFAGVLMAIAFPAIIMAYVTTKKPQYAKPVGAIFALAAAAGIITFVAFGFISPDTYIIDEEAMQQTEQVEEEVVTNAPVFTIAILEGSAEQGNPDYEPDVANVAQGYIVEWVNEDTVAHTVTSSIDFGETFDSGMMNAGDTFSVDTTELALGEYEYMCIVHPWMISTLVIEEAREPVTVEVRIPDGAGIQQPGQIYYDPEVVDVSTGTTVIWNNVDTTIHTVTSGTPDIGPDGVFDSELIAAGDSFEYTFNVEGAQDYYCIVHPWMIGLVNVE